MNMDFFGLLVPIVIIAIIAFIVRTNWFKGASGEFVVNLTAKLSLDKEKYHLINNVTLPTEDGSTQIDHVIVSQYGVFVIETKNMKGWIFGSPQQKMWTQQIYRHKNKFQNPLHQNYKHTKVLGNLLGLQDNQIFSVVVFVGDSTFKTKMPENVTRGRDFIRFIKSKTEIILSREEVKDIIKKIETVRLTPSFKTNREHKKHVKTIVARKTEQKQTPKCPKCGSSMIIREVKRGQNAGKVFWGCSRFPKCKGTINIT